MGQSRKPLLIVFVVAVVIALTAVAPLPADEPQKDFPQPHGKSTTAPPTGHKFFWGELTSVMAIGGETPGWLLTGTSLPVSGSALENFDGMQVNVLASLFSSKDLPPSHWWWRVSEILPDTQLHPAEGQHAFSGLLSSYVSEGETRYELRDVAIETDLSELPEPYEGEGEYVICYGDLANVEYVERGMVTVLKARSVKPVAEASSHQNHIAFGSSGGFTGGSTRTVVTADGLVLFGESFSPEPIAPDSYRVVKVISSRRAQMEHERINEVLLQYEDGEIGNMNLYIEFEAVESMEPLEVGWSIGSPAHAELEALYNELQQRYSPQQ